MNRWHGKHPLPWDFFNTFSNASGKDLNWFWNAWFFSPNSIDLSIKDVQTTANKATVSIQNMGGMPAPFDVVVTYADSTAERFHQTPAVWQTDIKATTISVNTNKPIASIKLDGGIFMDANPKDNEWKKAAM